MKKPEMTKAVEEALVKEVKDAFDYDLKAWQEVRDEGDTDMKYVGLDPWDSDDRAARAAAGRPCITTDELGQYLNQPINEAMMNPRAVKFSATGNGANDKTAKLYENKMREIEYRSVAVDAYNDALANAVQRSFGWVRVDMRFVRGSFKKELWIEAIPNPNSVLPDANSVKPDSSDMKRLFVFDMLRVPDFIRDYPWAEIQSFGPDLIAQSNGWLTNTERVRIAEYWKVEDKPKTLRLYQRGQETVEKYTDDPKWNPRGWKKLAEREDQVPEVYQYLTNGLEILKKVKWVGKSIPFVSCYGKILWLNDNGTPVRKILSMTRAMRDPYMAMCWTLSNEVEAIGTITKNPYWGYEGQISPKMLEEIKKSLHEPVAMLMAKPYLDGMNGTGPLLPLPVKNPLTTDLTAYAISAEQWRRAIQSAAGSNFLPTNAQKRNDKSGVALDKIDETAQKGTHHFKNSQKGMIRRVGQIVEEVLEPAVDQAQETTVVEPNGTSRTVQLVAPGAEYDGKTSFSVRGDHAVTVSDGPSYESEREAASDFADVLAQNENIFPLIGPLVVKLKNLGPIGDEIAKALETLQPPELRKQEEGKEGPDPAQLQAQLQKATQLIEMAKQEIAERDKIIETKQLERETELQKADMDGKVKIEIAHIQAGNKAETTQITTAAKVHDTDTSAEVDLKILRMESAIKAQELMLKKQELALKALTLQHQSEEAEHAREHDGALAEYGARTSAAQGERSHEQSLETANVGHEHAIEQQDKAAEASE